VPGLQPEARIHAVLGDSHAALYGHGVRDPGAVKVTLGTGSSVMGLSDRPVPGAALARTIAWSDPQPHHAFEGNILATGATLVWLANLLGVEPADVAALAEAVPESSVDLVPAFAGLGAPWWDGDAQAVLTGFDLGTGPADVARAAVDSIALQVEDVLAAADAVTGTRIGTVHVDGGPAGNDRLVQLLADLSQRRVRRPDVPGLSAVGAAHLAGLVAGVWTAAEVLALERRADDLHPALAPERAAARRERWHAAVARARATR
jgi:glycerol kinase